MKAITEWVIENKEIDLLQIISRSRDGGDREKKRGRREMRRKGSRSKYTYTYMYQIPMLINIYC